MEEREKSKPVVSVIIPVYNLENYLDTCLDSVGRQTYGDFEAIVVDDGSTDGSQAVALRHAERDARIVVISTVNQGAARARETGIRHAKGDYICFLDGDDVWDSRMLEKLVAAIGENGGVRYRMLRLQTYLQDLRSAQARNAHVGHAGLDFLVASLYHAISVTVWGRLYRRALFEKELRHYPLRLGEDSLLNIQIGCQQPRVRFVDYVGYGYVQRGGSANRSPLDIGYCVKFSEAVHAELVRHRDVVGDRLEFYLLLNKMRWYLVYLRKSHNPWAGDTGVCPRDQCGGGTLPAPSWKGFSAVATGCCCGWTGGGGCARGARRLDPDALGQEPEAAADTLNPSIVT